MMPALFIGHGTPMNALEDNRFTRAWKALIKEMPRPKAILVISAHWETPGQVCLTAQSAPPTIHDFGGFPPALFAQQYPAPGAPELAAEIASKLSVNARLSSDWGLDHGTWSILCHLFPAADIPVLQLSLDSRQPPAWHYQLGRELLSLRQQNILILGSGNIAHNIRKWLSDPQGPADWAVQFDAAVADALQRRDHDALIHYQQLPYARDAVPTAEHYLPLLYIAALQQPEDTLTYTDIPATDLETASMRSLRIGPALPN